MGRIRIPKEDRPALARRYATGTVTLEELASEYGVTREAIRIMIWRLDPGVISEGKRARVSVREAAEERRKVEKREEREALAAARGLRCDVCWGPNPRATTNARSRTCSHRCKELWTLLRYQLSDEHHEKAREWIARWTLANQDHPSVTQIRIRYAERVLAGEKLEYRPPFEPFSARVREGLAEVERLRAQNSGDTTVT